MFRIPALPHVTLCVRQLHVYYARPNSFHPIRLPTGEDRSESPLGLQAMQERSQLRRRIESPSLALPDLGEEREPRGDRQHEIRFFLTPSSLEIIRMRPLVSHVEDWMV